jgi:putative ABC transport system permease protein
MIKFLFKGLIRDRSRSLFPFLTIFIGVFLTVVFYAWVKGIEGNIVESSAKLDTGHVKIMTRAYARDVDQIPNDLALLGVEELLENVRGQFPGLIWTARIKFGGLFDVPDEKGETKAQGPVFGLGLDLLSASSPEPGIVGLAGALVRGRLPQKTGEVLVSDEFAARLRIEPGKTVTLISSAMSGGMATANFILAGTVRFGMAAMDRGTMIADLGDIRQALDMEDAAGEVLGFFRDGFYRQKESEKIASAFNSMYSGKSDEFLPVMDTLINQSGLAEMLGMWSSMIGIILAVFILPMSIVLWNAGLMGSIRRYGETGVRLALGEANGHVYRSLIVESLMVGLAGTLAGTALGLGAAYILQSKGVNLGSLFQNASILMASTIRARITPEGFVVGFVPGLLATLLGSCISGIGIYRRKTSRLLKELEA